MTEEAVLNALKTREGGYVSGEELSRLGGVSRTAIWKEIQKLRGEGYKILASPHLGYRLVGIPDRLTAQELRWNLQTRRVGNRIHTYDTTDSTMDIAHRLAASGEPEGSVILAEAQRQGRGRLGRQWTSPKGKGVYLSLILRPKRALSEVSLITLMAAVAVAQTIERVTELKPEIKWPNDLLIRGKKICGILTELNAEVNRLHDVVIGIGINVNTPRSALPPRATSLAQETGAKVDRITLARTLFMELDRAYEQFLTGSTSTLLNLWRGYATFLGRRIRVNIQNRMVDGQAVDVDASGALLVRTDAGMVESVAAGEVLVVR